MLKVPGCLYMARMADFLAGMYPETVDRDLLVAGTILHDAAQKALFQSGPQAVDVP